MGLYEESSRGSIDSIYGFEKDDEIYRGSVEVQLFRSQGQRAPGQRKPQIFTSYGCLLGNSGAYVLSR